MRYDAIVIGAGMSGLAAAIRLGSFGKRVCVLEKQANLGGLNTFYERNGRVIETGLHALTNYGSLVSGKGAVARLLRHLGINWKQLRLAPQKLSEIRFGDLRLQFGNDPEVFFDQLKTFFPSESLQLRELIDERLLPYEHTSMHEGQLSARQVLQEWLANRSLTEIILLPVFFFGSPREHDLDFKTFSVLFRSIFLEGLARPTGGIRELIRCLHRRLEELGIEVRLNCCVTRLVTRHDRITRVELTDGETLEADLFISCAGWPETWNLLDQPSIPRPPVGRLSFVEVVAFLAKCPRDLGITQSLIFFAITPEAEHRCPKDLVDCRRGVMCLPGNFSYETDGDPQLSKLVRITVLANPERWDELTPPEYEQRKTQVSQQIFREVFGRLFTVEPAVEFLEVATPRTIRSYTGRLRGAIYGSPEKLYDGRTPYGNLLICGTDQGLVGIVGALTSGVLVANQYLLRSMVDV